jgi:nucleoside-diphosphate-sugar epimerase
MADRYLVAGCAGFIGARVSELLLDAGHEVLGIDNLNDAYDPRLKEWRLARLTARPGFVWRRVDIAQRDQVDALAEFTPLAGVINLAARAGVRASLANPWIYIDANVTGTLNLLEVCRRHGVKKFVLASSSSLYGVHNSIPYREDADVSRPPSPYAASKLAAEGLAHAYHHVHGLDVSVLRFFTVYGPAGRPDMGMFRFIHWVDTGQPVRVLGDGSQRRDFTYIDDIADGVVRALRPLGYAVLNLGGDHPVTVLELIEQIAAQLGRPARIDFGPAHPADVPATWADITRAGELLGWRPQVALAEGLRRTIAWRQAERELATSIDLGLS